MTLRVVVEVDTGMHRAGTLPGEPTVALAKRVAASPSLRFVGVMGWEGHATRAAEPGVKEARIAEAVGLTAAIEYLEKLGMARVTDHEREITRQALHELAPLPGLTIYGPRAVVDRGAVVSFGVKGLHPHDIAALLDAEGIAVRAGHHCAQPLARRLGIVGTTRASFSVYTSAEEVSRLASALVGLDGL